MEASNTSMDASSANWLSDLLLQEWEDSNSFRQCNLNLFDDDDFVSQDIASVLQVENLQQPLSCESYSSYSQPSSNSETLRNSSTDESSFERPAKQRKRNSSSFEHLSPNLSCSSNFVTFENSKSKSKSSPAATKQFCTLSQKLVSGSPENQKAQGQGRERSPPQALDHIMAERRRREKLSQSLIALAALIPGLKKMDKASVLGDAIKYVKELQERLRILEEQNKNRQVESVVMVGKSELSSEDHSSSRDESLPLVEARVSEKDVLLRIHCQKQKGLLLKILGQIQNLHLSVVNSSVLPFGDSILDITIVAQMGRGYQLSTNDLVKNIRVASMS